MESTYSIQPKQQIIIEEILKLMEDGREHSVTELKQYLVGKGFGEIDTALRNAIFKLKKTNPYFKNIQRGIYKLEINMEQNSKDSISIEEAVECINKELTKIREFDWVNCTDAELNLARKKVQLLQGLEHDIRMAFK